MHLGMRIPKGKVVIRPYHLHINLKLGQKKTFSGLDPEKMPKLKRKVEHLTEHKRPKHVL
jgi:hypothetical protein